MSERAQYYRPFGYISLLASAISRGQTYPLKAESIGFKKALIAAKEDRAGALCDLDRRLAAFYFAADIAVIPPESAGVAENGSLRLVE